MTEFKFNNLETKPMKRASTLLAFFLWATVTLPWGSPARAQSITTFVSSLGSNSNSCAGAAPTAACASFSTALSKTSEGGAVFCVDTNFFGGGTITKSVTIDCTAGGGAANASSFIINAPGKTVGLRNVAINSLTVTAPGVEIAAASQVYFENVFITGNSVNKPGVYDHRAGPSLLIIKNSSVTNYAGPGIAIAPASGAIGVELDNVTSAYNGYGIAVGNGGRVVIRNSSFMNNTNAGIEGDAGSLLQIDSSKMSFNPTGIQSGGSTSVSQSQFVSNTTGISGPTRSYGNNQFDANSTDGTAPTPVSSK